MPPLPTQAQPQRARIPESAARLALGAGRLIYLWVGLLERRQGYRRPWSLERPI